MQWTTDTLRRHESDREEAREQEQQHSTLYGLIASAWSRAVAGAPPMCFRKESCGRFGPEVVGTTRGTKARNLLRMIQSRKENHSATELDRVSPASSLHHCHVVSQATASLVDHSMQTAPRDAESFRNMMQVWTFWIHT